MFTLKKQNMTTTTLKELKELVSKKDAVSIKNLYIKNFTKSSSFLKRWIVDAYIAVIIQKRNWESSIPKQIVQTSSPRSIAAYEFAKAVRNRLGIDRHKLSLCRKKQISLVIEREHFSRIQELNF
jgi:dTDP-4-dehydrorhamnose reductase